MTSEELLQLDPSPAGRLKVLLMWGLVNGFCMGDSATALRWFTTPNPLLGQVSPAQYIQLGRTDWLLTRIQTRLQENLQ